VEIGNFSNLTNAWWASAIRTRGERIHASTSFNVLEMFSNLSGDELLAFEVNADVDAVASYDTASESVIVSVINYTERDDITLEINLDGFEATSSADVTFVSSPSMTWLNDFDSPNRITPTKGAPTDITKVNIMPCSLMYLKFPVR